MSRKARTFTVSVAYVTKVTILNELVLAEQATSQKLQLQVLGKKKEFSVCASTQYGKTPFGWLEHALHRRMGV